VDDRCTACWVHHGTVTVPDYSVEPDDGSEVLVCAAHLGALAGDLFDQRLASGELKVYDVRPR
jgi:hypothetical protein